MRLTRPHAILARSGRTFDFADPTPGMVEWSDVARALEHEGRWGNQSDVRTTVLQHLLFCWRVASSWGWVREARLAALLHDAPEAYLRDVPGPLKDLLPDYRAVEERVADVVMRKAGLAPDKRYHSAVHELDKLACKLEAHVAFSVPPEWASVSADGLALLELWPRQATARDYLSALNKELRQ
jgi:hypothetical protein